MNLAASPINARRSAFSTLTWRFAPSSPASRARDYAPTFSLYERQRIAPAADSASASASAAMRA